MSKNESKPQSQKRIQNSVKHFLRELFAKIVNAYKMVTIFAKTLLLMLAKILNALKNLILIGMPI